MDSIHWDKPYPFCANIQVESKHIDSLGHVNNVVYVSWLEHCAWQHANSLGIDLNDYHRLNRAMVVVRHELNYLASAFAEDQLIMATWITQSDLRLKLRRQFQLIRPADGRTLLRAATNFVCIELSSGAPKRMPPLFAEAYGKALQLQA